MKIHVSFAFSSFQGLLETGVSLKCPILKRPLVTKVESDSWSPVVGSLLPHFKNFLRIL